MKKENRFLIIYAVLFTLIAIGFIVGFKQFEKTTKTEDINSGALVTKTTYYKGGKVSGYSYVGSGSVEDVIPGTIGQGPKELRIEVYTDDKHVITNVRIVKSEHTPDYIKYVLEYFNTLPGTSLIDYKLVDEVSGASAASMPIVRQILTEVTVLATGQQPTERPEIDPYKEIFADYVSKEKDASFVVNETITNKEIIKDKDGNILGHAYTIKDTTPEDIPGTGKGKLSFLVGVSEGKIVGYYELENNHSKVDDYYNKYNDFLASLKGTTISELSVDNQGGASVSGGALGRIFDALKAAESTEPVDPKLVLVQSFFSRADDYVETEVVSGSMYLVVEAKRGTQTLGYIYRAKDTNQRGLVDIGVGYDTNGKLVAAKIIETENTDGYYTQYIENEVLIGLTGRHASELVGIDNIGGVTQTGNLLNELLKDISDYTRLNVYKEIYETVETVTLDDTFTPTEHITKKEVIKDKDGVILGYAYTAVGTSNEPLHDYDDSGKTYTHSLLIGLDTDKKVVGILTAYSEHTPSYYVHHDSYFTSLVGTDITVAPIDNVSGATVTRNIIRILIDAIKEVA